VRRRRPRADREAPLSLLLIFMTALQPVHSVRDSCLERFRGFPFAVAGGIYVLPAPGSELKHSSRRSASSRCRSLGDGRHACSFSDIAANNIDAGHDRQSAIIAEARRMRQNLLPASRPPARPGQAAVHRAARIARCSSRSPA